MTNTSPKIGKKYVGTWVNKREHAELKRAARRESRSIAYLLKQAIKGIIAKSGAA